MARRRPMQSTREARSLRSLPAVSRLMAARPLAALVARHGSRLVTGLLRDHLARLREAIRAGGVSESELGRAVRTTAMAAAVRQALATLLEPHPRTVINATGVIVHTNLGRAILSEEAARQVARTACSYLDLEYDLAGGGRGDRLSHLEPLMSRLFPGHGYAVVNNNAAAILLCLRALCRGREALISRGELVEIGGSFRVPDILAAAGAKLREVGTTNRTRIGDFERALSPRTGLILKVHTSNFKIVGFTEEVSVDALARLARRAGLPLVVDWGSGDLVDLGPLGIKDEQPVSRVLSLGADLVTFSGDKLLGGPQAGFVIGRPELIERVRRDPLARAVRIDRLLLGALHQNLAAYVRGRAFEEVPTLRMLALSAAEIDRRATRVRREVERKSGARHLLSVIDGVSRSGGGSSPTGERPTRLLCVAAAHGDALGVERHLRSGTPPVVVRMHDNKVMLDLRTVLPEQDAILIDRLTAALRQAAGR